MRIRIRFSKNISVRYLGHLDIMRTFQRCFNRANIKMTYSEGFNPHQKMHFALPLGVGIMSRGEYLDAQIADGQDPFVVMENLNRVCGNGFYISAVKELREDALKAMACVRYASYEILFAEDYGFSADDYLARENILIAKKTKTGIKDVDVKDILLSLTKDGRLLSILMKAGSETNLKPELLAFDLLAFHKIPVTDNMFQITRTELYAQDVIPLIDFQTVS